MPAGKRQQGSPLLYTLIVFVFLFVAATTVAVIYYVRAEEYRKSVSDLQRQINELVTGEQLQKIGAIVGTKQPRQSWLGTMVEYLDQIVTLMVGGVPEPTSAEVKVNDARRRFEDTLSLVQEYVDIGADPNIVGLVPLMEKLKMRLDNTIQAAETLKQQLDDQQQEYKRAMAASFEKEQILLAEKEKYQQQVNNIKQKYAELESLLQKTTDEQVQTLRSQLEKERGNLNTLNQKFLKTQAELEMAQDMLKRAQQELRKIKPEPDREVAAYKPDGKIILIDDAAKVVHLNIGSDDHVYRGLTFSVYDRNSSITKDGKGKAEVEVFDVGKNVSAARIIRSEINRPILLGDVVANLIWDKDKTNVFVVAGEFDVDNDGSIDYDGIDKIKSLIERWGGRVAENLSIDTDFLILGRVPRVLRKPTAEEAEIHPTAMQKYEASQKKFNRYQEVQRLAQTLWIPVFTYERFLYFIGYKGHVSQAGAFGR